MEAKNIDWKKVSQALPYKADADSKARRLKLWKLVDINGNGYASLAEVDKALRDAMNIDAVFKCKPAIIMAFTAAKNSSKTTSKYGPDYVELKEFRHLLYSLRQYFEYYQAFGRIDTSDDNRIDLKEFTAALLSLVRWVGHVADPVAEFNKIDKNGGGQILFNEFVPWALSKNLDLEDDEE